MFSPFNTKLVVVLASVILVVAIYGVTLRFRMRTGPGPMGIVDGRFHACERPRACASSDAPEGSPSFVEPIVIVGDAEVTWSKLRSSIESMPRTQIVSATDDYLRAEFTMPIIPFVDDLELHRRDSKGIVAVRSLSRIGNGDLGVNRRRVERLRRRIGQ